MMANNSQELNSFNTHAYGLASDSPLASGPDLTALFTTSKTSKEKEMEEMDHGACASPRGSLPPSYSTAQLMVGFAKDEYISILR